MTISNRPCDTLAGSLHDFLDGDLPEAEGRKLRLHLEACDSCRREFDQLQELCRQAAELNVEVAPRRDLWPDIAARLETRSHQREGQLREGQLRESQLRESQPREEQSHQLQSSRFQSRQSQSRRQSWTKLPAQTAALAAALVLLVLSGLAALYFVPTASMPGPDMAGPRGGGPTTVLPASTDTDASFRQVEIEFEQARRQLRTALAQRHDQLSPATLEIVERNLTLIDQAIGDIRQALDEDPENQELRHLLTASYQREVQLLRRATQLPQS